MAFVIADRVRESSTTTGTGSITLGGAVIGYQTFDAVLDTGDTTYYTIADQGGANWEVGIGTFTSPSTLARTTILSSSNGGSVVTFTAGTKDVFISLPASKTNTNDQPNVIAVNSTSEALRITQTGTGNALVVEDSTNPDATPFVVEANGRLIVGYTATVPSVGVSGTPQIGVFSGSTTNNGFANYSYTASTGASAFNFAKSRSTTFGTPSIVLVNDDLGYIRFNGDDGTQFLEAARIWSEVDGTPGLNSMPGRLLFSTTPSGATAAVTRMTIGSTGNIGIGTAGTEPFTIRNLRNFSGATTAYGISQGGQIQSGVTGSVFVNHTAPTTQATAFTLTAVYHYSANSLTIGAGSAVTNQYGFFAGSGLTTALTNNYGFYSDIASGTGRWNFYAAGTADNFFGGPTTISTSSTTDALRITQTGTGNALVIEDSTNPDSTPFVVDADGRLLVGTTTNVAGTTSLQLANKAVSGTPAALDYSKDRAGATVVDGDQLGYIRYFGYDGTAYRQAASIVSEITGTVSSNIMPANITFRTRSETATGDQIRMSINSSGSVIIGNFNGDGAAISTTNPAKLRLGSGQYTDNSTAASGTVNFGTLTSIVGATVNALNTGVTYTSLATVYINAAPTAGTNVTITNPYAFYVAAGTSYFAGQVQLGAGTAAAPALSTTGDTNTGIFFPAADTIAFSTAGTEDFRIGSAGQLGVQGANYGTAGQVLTSGGAAAAPSWATVTATGRLINTQVFTSSGTYTRTAGVTTAVVIAVGAGGGGTGANGTSSGGNGGNGGTTSFGSHVTAAGGSGSTGRTGGAGGTGGTGATLAIKGQGGGASSPWGVNSGGGNGGGQGGGAGVNSNNGASAGNAGVRGGGGSGAATYVGGCCGGAYAGGGGGQGETCIDYITTVGATETVTIGAGGTAGTGSSTGGAGGAGYIIVYEYS